MTTIIDTDYDDYAVVYSCTNSLLSGVFHSEYIWVLSRSGKISNPTRQNIYEKLDRLQINRSGLTMSDRSTCPTNSSTVARESDKDLAGSGQLNGASASGASASGAPSAEGVTASPSEKANLEKASANSEPTQKSVVVPLLYDLPTSASSASVGASKPSASKAPPAPVENKVPQLPVSSSVSSSQLKQQQVGAAAAKPASAQQSGAAAASASAGVAVSAASASQAASAPAQPAASSASKAQLQQPQQQSLLAKIQQKP